MTRASPRGCCAPIATRSRSGTSSRGSRSRAPSRRHGGGRCTARSSPRCAEPPSGEPDPARLAHHAEEAGDDAAALALLAGGGRARVEPRRPPRGRRAVRARASPRRGPHAGRARRDCSRPTRRRCTSSAVTPRRSRRGSRRSRSTGSSATGSRGRQPRAADHAVLQPERERQGRAREPRRDRGPRRAAAEPRAGDGVRLPGVRADARSGQRRGRRLGREGGRARRALRRPRHASRRAEHDRHVVRDGRRDRARVRLPESQSRDRAARRSRGADRLGLLDARHGPRRDVRARAFRALPARAHRVRRGVRPRLALHERVARLPCSSTAAVGTRAQPLAAGGARPRGGRRRSPRRPRTIALGRIRARRGDPGPLERTRRGARALAGRAGTSSGSATSTRRAPRRPGSQATASEPRREARAAYALALEKRHLWFAGELAYWQWKAGALDPPSTGRRTGSPSRTGCSSRATPRAAAAWRARGCPYEAARALAEAGRRGGAARVAGRARRPRRRARGEARPRAAALARRRRPARAARLDARQSGGAHGPRGRGAAARRRAASATRTSPSSSCSRVGRSITTSRRSCASCACRRAARRPPRPRGSACSKTGSAAAQDG